MADKTREELENILGPADEFVLTNFNRAMLRKWAIAIGRNPVDVAVMSPVALTNLYHAEAGRDNGPNDTQRITAELFVAILNSVNVPGFNVDLTREITRQEIEGDACRPALERIAAAAIQTAIEAMPPRRFEIASPRGVVTLDGPLHYRTEQVIRAAARNHPVMMVGPAGCGKTTIGEHVSRALQLPFYITSTINDTHELTGFVDGYGKYHSTPFRKAFEQGGVWVADEIDAWDASALLAANSALANGYSVFPDNELPVRRSEHFRMIATANTFGNGADRVYIGRNELDAASLDRFAMIEVDYDLNLEQFLSNGNQRWLEYVWKIRKIVNEKKIRHVVSTRAITMGSAALADGDKLADVENMYLFKGMSASDRSKCK